jgi:hypothetical protein
MKILKLLVPVLVFTELAEYAYSDETRRIIVVSRQEKDKFLQAVGEI